ncbi:MAG: hypothetical protein ACI4XS_09490, partial [Bacillus sp. (in: firmicutes)]
MNKSMLDRDKIEAVLKKLPKIQDQRSIQTILIELNEAEELRSKKRNRYRYVLVSTMAVLLFSVITSTIFLNDEFNSEQQLSVSRNADEAKESLRDDAASEPPEILENTEATAFRINDATLLFADELEGDYYMTLAAPTKDVQYFVPFTIKLAESAFELDSQELEGIRNTLNVSAYGLADYFPLNAQFEYVQEQNAVVVNIPTESIALYADRLFLDVLQETFTYQEIDTLVFKTNGQNGINFPHLGFLEEQKIIHHRQRAVYVYQFDDQSPQLFVSSIYEYDDISVALEAMRHGEDPVNEFIHTAIPESVQFEEIEPENEQLIITFSSDTILENTQQYEIAISAILLAARDFNYQTVRFQNG